MGKAKDGSNRGSSPGEHRGGRAAGTPNRRTVEVLATLSARGFDPDAPFLFWAEVLREGRKHANDATVKKYITSFFEGAPVWSRPTLTLMLDAARELAAYVAPKRKAIELTDAAGEPLRPRLNYADLPEVLETPGGGVTIVMGRPALPSPASAGQPSPKERATARPTGQRDRSAGGAKPTRAPRMGGAPRPGGKR